MKSIKKGMRRMKNMDYNNIIELDNVTLQEYMNLTQKLKN